ncbi:hypothetical protein LINGRAHAP2_LOCUS4349, partial [Linum grandiflorum]
FTKFPTNLHCLINFESFIISTAITADSSSPPSTATNSPTNPGRRGEEEEVEPPVAVRQPIPLQDSASPSCPYFDRCCDGFGFFELKLLLRKLENRNRRLNLLRIVLESFNFASTTMGERIRFQAPDIWICLAISRYVAYN